MFPWHVNQEGKHIINKSAENFVQEHFPRHMHHRLESIVHIKLRTQSNKTERIHRIGKVANEPGVPRLVDVVLMNQTEKL
jgi:hypothetical protein